MNNDYLNIYNNLIKLTRNKKLYLMLEKEDTFSDRLPDAYERLLMDVVRGNQTLFMRSDEVLAAWDFIDPIVEIAKNQETQLYRTGTMGPEDKILVLEGHQWLDPKDE